MNIPARSDILFLFVFAAVFGITLEVKAASETCANPVAKVIAFRGLPKVHNSASEVWTGTTVDQIICGGDSISTDRNSNATIFLFKTNTYARLDSNTALKFNLNDHNAPEMSTRILDGLVYFFSRTKWHLEIDTPHVNGGIDGTEILVRVDTQERKSSVLVFEGVYGFEDPDSGDKGVLSTNQAAEFSEHGIHRVDSLEEINQLSMWRFVSHPLDTVQWVINFPRLIRQQSNNSSQLIKIHELIQIGQLGRAERALKNLPETTESLSFLAIIEIAKARDQDDRDQALKHARQATNLDPASVPAALALSYALQANTQLGNALEHLLSMPSKNDGLLLTRIAELQLAHGKIKEAKIYGQQAIEVEPNLAQAHSVLGFAYLGEKKYKQAEAVFHQAIRIDPNVPESSLGLGLVQIARGRLKEGILNLERAVILNPNFSLFRSYLGRAYLDENTIKRARTQFDLAIRRDPQDSFPNLLSAVERLYSSAPITALKFAKAAEELDVQRGVYRTKDLLGSDRAVKGSTIATIYGQLDLHDLGVIEASKAVELDPKNQAAYRSRSDLHTKDARVDQIRITDLLISRLLQPISHEVYPGFLEEQGLFTYDNPISSAFGLNSYEQAFDKNGLGGFGSLMAGSHDTVSNQLFLSAVHGPLGLNLSNFHYETDGFRENADVRHGVWSAHLAAKPTPRLKVQLDYRNRRSRQGDISQNFDPEQFSIFQTENLDHETIRAGLVKEFGRRHLLIVNGSYEQLETLQSDVTPAAFTEISVNADGFSVQIQSINTFESFNIISGTDVDKFLADGIFAVDISNSFGGVCPPFIASCKFVTNAPIKDQSITAYSYMNWNVLDRAVITLGASGTFVDSNLGKFSKFNPKVGFSYNVLEGLEISAAYHPYVANSRILGNSLEPTHIAHLPQFRDDLSKSQVKAISAQLKWSIDKYQVYTGGGWQRTISDIPRAIVTTGQVDEHRYRESESKLYLTKLIGSKLSLGSKLSHRKQWFDIPGGGSFIVPVDELRTIHIPTTVKLFPGKGFNISVTNNFVRQYIVAPSSLSTEKETSTLSTFDASLSWQLPSVRAVASLQARNIFGSKFKYHDPFFVTEDADPSYFIPKPSIIASISARF